MSSRKGSVDSFDEFFGETKPDNNNDKKQKEDDISPSIDVANPIRTQPIIHHPQTASDKISNKNSETILSTKHINKTSASLSSKSKHIDSQQSKSIDSPQSKIYESDFDDNKEHENIDINIDNKKNYILLSSQKKHSSEIIHRTNETKLKTLYTLKHDNIRRKEKFLPYIRPSKQRKGITKRYPKDNKNEIEKRLLSAQNNKLKQLQSYINEIRRQLEEERIENRTLLLIQKREEKDLKKYTNQLEDIRLIAQDFTQEIEDVKEKINNEREIKLKLEQEIEQHDHILQNQTKRMRFFKKLLINETNLNETEQLREQLNEANKKLKKYQEIISNKEKEIENLEKNYRHEINHELIKQRNLKHEIDNHSIKYNDLLLKCEDKTRQIDTMHIYIQRGGRRPSHSSSKLTKSYSLQSLQDTSPRFREKILEYDKKRREQQQQQQKLKPKLKPLILPNNNPPLKHERKKYIPKLEQKSQTKKSSSILSHIKHDEKSSTIENEHLLTKDKRQVRRLSTPNSIDEDKSELDDETVSDFIHLKPPSAPTKGMQRREQHLSQSPIHKRSLTPLSPPFESKFSSLGTNESTTTTSNLLKRTEPLPLVKPPVKRQLDDKWTNLIDINKKEESTKEDLLSKLLSDEEQEKKSTTTTQLSPPSSQPASLIMFEPTSSSTNGHLKKPPTRLTTTNVYDFNKAVINLHDGVPVTAQPTTTTKTRTSIDPFESLFNNKSTKSTNHVTGRDDTFTTTTDKSDPFDSPFGESPSATNISTTIKPNSKQYPLQNDKLQRPKVVTNPSKPVPNRTVVEEIEEFVL
ncbi:unnamed protein product [Rotaria sp. Silwood1]|nr:unnamed protein product [Rotaria sp. Silwood1]CAF4889974.1 unnamed protein product [Rotaria sp. Silwood1]